MTAEAAKRPDPALTTALRTWRAETSRADGVPAYVVFSDATLEAIARRRPLGRAQLLAIDGIGPVKLQRYGQDILGIIGEHGGTGPAPDRLPSRVPQADQAHVQGPVGAPACQRDEGRLVTALKSWRVQVARAERVPAYVVFRDATIEAIARARPGTLSELMSVHGVGPAKLERYGRSVLELVSRVDG
jgi:superfamily II DNA helicase RecQ